MEWHLVNRRIGGGVGREWGRGGERLLVAEGGEVSPSNKSYGPKGLGENITLVRWENARAASEL